MLSVNLKKYVTAGVAVFLLSSILCAADAYAVFENLTSTGWEIFGGMRKIIFGASAFGIIAVAIGGFFGVCCLFGFGGFCGCWVLWFGCCFGCGCCGCGFVGVGCFCGFVVLGVVP